MKVFYYDDRVPYDHDFRPNFDLFTVLTINQFETFKDILETSEFKKVKIKND